jgi:hypothetical protein
MIFILGLSYAFYLMVEKPSHRASRYLASLSKGKIKTPLPAST